MTTPAPKKSKKANVGTDPTKGSRVGLWQRGLYVFAILVVAVLVIANGIVLARGSVPRIGLLATLVVVGVTWTLLTAKAGAIHEPTGVRVGASDPRLLDFVHMVADTMDAPKPDEVYVVAEPHLGLDEATRFFGLQVNRRVLSIGLPFLNALTERELAVGLAHQFGHYGESDVAQGARGFRALRAARWLIAKERDGVINGVFGSYARKMFRSVGGVGVAQEEAADVKTVAAFGTSAMVSALQKHDDIIVGFNQLLREDVVPVMQREIYPVDMFADFNQMLAAPERIEQRATELETQYNAPRSEFELHLTARERLQVIESWPATNGSTPASVAGAELAIGLLDPADGSSATVIGLWAHKVSPGTVEPRSWAEIQADS